MLSGSMLLFPVVDVAGCVETIKRLSGSGFVTIFAVAFRARRTRLRLRRCRVYCSLFEKGTCSNVDRLTRLVSFTVDERNVWLNIPSKWITHASLHVDELRESQDVGYSLCGRH